jgi:signal transduction histidine kinase
MRLRKETHPELARFRAHVPWYALVAFLTLAAALVLTIAGDVELDRVAGPIGIFAGSTAAGFVFIHTAGEVDPGERRAWTSVGIGFAIAAMGVVVLALQVLITGDAPTYGPIDLAFLTSYVLIIVGFALLPHTSGDRLQAMRIGLDGLIGAISIGALFWVLLLSDAFAGLADAPIWERLIGSLYPLLDIAILGAVMIVILRRSSYRFDPRLVLFATGGVLYIVGDVSFLAAGAGSSFADAEPLYAAYLLAVATFLVTALIIDRSPQTREYADRVTPLWTLLAPYTAAIIMVLVLATRLVDNEIDTGDQILLGATLAVAFLVIARQALAIRENRILVEKHRTDLVTSISHELRTPLTAMVGFLSILHYNEVSGPAERAELIGVVHHQANYLERIVEDLLLLADEDPSGMSLTMGAADVRATIEHALNATAINHDRVTVEAPPGMIAHVDPERLEQVLVNLITNADRYGGERCLIRAFARGGTLVLEVHDAGSGVPKKHELLIWERFERGPNRYNALTPGTGIGLAVVKAIAQAHGGKVGYRRSDELGGGCFWIELPGRLDTEREPARLDLRPPAEVEQIDPVEAVTTRVARKP